MPSQVLVQFETGEYLDLKAAFEKRPKEAQDIYTKVVSMFRGANPGSIEERFYTYGQEFAIIALYIATNNNYKVFRDIGDLDAKDRVKLIKDVIRLPQERYITNFTPGANKGNTTAYSSASKYTFRCLTGPSTSESALSDLSGNKSIKS
ncbi:hypothetical protein VC83_08599 [Pseudogymnoascus destructans]|uniref:Uncharacterized protein n=1 Tax=Pseudogymnoascus destructans TaxID=655981 RepID=A0A177A215_9PEZI|nr:uncharacterized protein VC83_09549 [Pseudogymnoascus destructans]XP_024319498.1 uncharacterized protein VC83_09515 [Pseudogymnoascus destructans]XP_024320277.1 uncharacterized protein VC83_08599 [Pseudogymnoascus destructans]OAF54178.1 hypothetical protein VC83_09549 [Pseudogymnoascus destructans]OAF54191.1 hypothetical protein VC83_09515 [Pseudogymnoascus destructans]OAF54974.1 hypothetical protein VC83_08599 [Pseudogymnoascus destructans]